MKMKFEWVGVIIWWMVFGTYAITMKEWGVMLLPLGITIKMWEIEKEKER